MDALISPCLSPINLRSLLPKFSIIPYLYHCGRNISINRFPTNHRVIYYRANNQSDIFGGFDIFIELTTFVYFQHHLLCYKVISNIQPSLVIITKPFLIN